MMIDAIGQGSAAKPRKVTFGSVTVLADPVSEEQVARVVKVGHKRMSKVMARLSKPGFALRKSKNVSYYRVDPDHPDIIIRELNGQTSRGRLVDGEFTAL